MPFPLPSSPLIDAVPALPSLRSLGTGAQQAISGVKVFGQVEFISGTYTLAPTDRYLQIQTHGVTVNLLATSNYLDNECIVIQDKTGSLAGFPVTVVPNGADHIDGAGSSLSFSTDNGVLVLRKTATGWWSQVTAAATILTLPSYALSSLPTPDGSIRLAKLTDYAQGLVYSNGVAWVQAPEFNVIDFGARATTDGSFDCLAAFNAAIAAMGAAAPSPSAGDLLVPKPSVDGAYYFLSGPLHVTRQLRIRGVGGDVRNQFGSAVKLVWPAGSNGIVIDYADGSTRDGIGAMVSNLALVSSRSPVWAPTTVQATNTVIIPRNRLGYVFKNLGSSGTTGSTEPSWNTTIGGTTSDGSVTWTTAVASAVQMLGSATVENCGISQWSGNGIHVEASVSASNANSWRLRDSFIQFCAGSGLFTAGTDANAGYAIGNTFDFNDAYGVRDTSILGNAYYANEISGNGWSFNGTGAGFWSALAVIPANSFILPTTRNGKYFKTTAGGTTGGTEPSWNTTIGGTTSDGGVTWTCFAVYTGGSATLGAIGDVNASTANGNYIESYTYPLFVGLNSRWEGGANGAGLDTTSTGFYATASTSTGVTFRNAAGGPVFQLGTDSTHPLKFDTGTTPTTNEYSLGYATGLWKFRGQDSDGQSPIGFTTPAFLVNNGSRSGIAGSSYFNTNGFYMGSDTRVFPSDDAPGTSGYLYGDIAVRNSYQASVNDGAVSWINLDTSGSTAARWQRVAETRKLVVTKTSGTNQIPTEQNGAIFSDFGSSGIVTFNLPSVDAQPNLTYGDRVTFVVESNGVKIVAAERSDKIFFGSTVSATNGYIQSTTPGDTVTLVMTRFLDTGVNTIGAWYVESYTGTWSVDGVIVPATATRQTTFVFEDFGGKANDSSSPTRTANNAAWEAMMLAIGPLATITQARVLFAQAAPYYFSGPLHFRHVLRLEGVIGGPGFNQNVLGSSGTSLFFPPSGRGLVIDYDPAGITGYSSGSHVSFLQVFHDQTLPVWQAGHSYVNGSAVCPVGTTNSAFVASKWTGYVFVNNGSTGTSGGSEPVWTDGLTPTPSSVGGATVADNGVTWTATLCPLVDVRSPFVTLQNVFSGYAYGDGIRLFGDTSTSIADLCTVAHCQSWGNRSNGLFIVGNDGNANVITNFSAVSNGTYGIYDIGFLANRYLNIHLSDNGASPWTASGSPALGTAISPTVANDYEYSVTTAGTAGMTEPVWPTTVGLTVTSGTTTYTCFRKWDGGPYYAPSSQVFGFYMEGGQMPAYNGTGGIIIGGSFGSGSIQPFTTSSTGLVIKSQQDVTPLFFRRVSSDPTYDVTLVDGDRSGNLVFQEFLVQHKNNVAYDSIVSEFNTSIQYLGFRNGSTGTESMWLPFGNSSHGPDAPVSFPNGISFNTPTASTEIFMRAATAVPATGTWPRGSVVWNTVPTQIGSQIAAGWVCTTGGTPGTWLAFNTGVDGIPSTLTPAGTTQTIDWSTGDVQKLSMASATGDVTVTLTNPVAGRTHKILITQGAGGHNVIWPAAVKWNGGTAPTITGTNGKTDQIILLDDGTNYFGTYFQNY